MFIQLNDKVAIKSDSYQYMLCKPINQTNKDTKEVEVVWKGYKFFPTLDKTLEAIPNQMLKESEVVSFKEAIKLLKDWENKVSNLFSKGA